MLLLEAVVLGRGSVMLPQPLDPLCVKALPHALGTGLQNAAMHSSAGVNVALTCITGTLSQFGRTLAGVLLGRGGAGRVMRFLWLLLSLATGTMLSGVVPVWSRPDALGRYLSVTPCLWHRLSGITAFRASRQRSSVG